MKWCMYLVTFFFCGFCDSQLEMQRSSSNNIYQQLFIKTINESSRKISKSVQESSRNTFAESDDFGTTLLKGKHCLSNLDECINRDMTHQASANHIINYLIAKAPPLNMNDLQGVSMECQKSHKVFIKDLHNFKHWALQMYDATAKLPSGFLNGNIIQFGDFDLCMKSRNIVHNIYGQYCLANIQIEVPSSPYLAAIYNLVHSHTLIRSKLTDSGHRIPRFSSIQWAICVPHACTPEDVNIAIKDELKHIFNGTEVQYNTLVNSDLCSSAKPEVWPITTIIGWLLFLSVILVELLATLYDIYKKESKNDLVIAFSIKHNFQRLCFLKSNDDIDAIHFVRFINGLILMAAHKSMALLFLPYVNRTSAAEELGAAWTVVGRAASLYTDPFIMISGTLTTYSLIGKLRESKQINIREEYMSRILRILPTFIFLIMFCTLILPWTNAGPLWKSVVTHHSDICKNNWWKNVLFIHNYFGFENMCLTHTHHIGIDTQLFLISPFLILLLWKWPKRGIIIMGLIATISTWMRYYSTYKRNLSNYVYYGASTEQLFRTADYMYIIPVYRLTVYIMGIILGYLLREYKDVKFKQVHIYIGSFFAMLCFIGGFLGPSFMGHIDYVYHPVDAAWYAAYSPILWCLSFAWMIYITHIGHTGYMAPILRNAIPRFWSKISYTVYLTQFPIYFYNVGTTKHTDEFGVIRKHLNFLEFFWIMCLSMILTLLIEIPSQNIKDYIFKKPRQLQDHTLNKKKY